MALKILYNKYIGDFCFKSQKIQCFAGKYEFSKDSNYGYRDRNQLVYGGYVFENLYSQDLNSINIPSSILNNNTGIYNNNDMGVAIVKELSYSLAKVNNIIIRNAGDLEGYMFAAVYCGKREVIEALNNDIKRNKEDTEYANMLRYYKYHLLKYFIPSPINLSNEENTDMIYFIPIDKPDSKYYIYRNILDFGILDTIEDRAFKWLYEIKNRNNIK